MCPDAHPQSPLKILIVEDNHDARTTMRLLLTMAHGYDVHEAPDGTSGIDSSGIRVHANHLARSDRLG